MKRQLLPIHKTGWLYLMLALWAVIYWLIDQGGFNWLNQFNRERLYQVVPGQQAQRQVVRVSSRLTSAEGDKLKQLLSRFVDVPVVLMGTPSSDLLTHLQDELIKTKRQAKVIVSTSGANSAAAVNRGNDSLPFYISGLEWFRYTEPESVQWRTSSQIIFAPLISHLREGLPVVWRNQDKVYLTLLGEILRQTHRQSVANIKAGWDLRLTLNNQHWPLGMQGDVYSAGQLPLSIPLEQWLVAQDVAKPRLIIVDDHSIAMSGELVRTTGRLLEHNYLYQSFALKAIHWLLFAVGVVFLWLVRGTTLTRQIFVIVSFMVVLWVLQYIAFTQRQWLAVAPLNISLLVTWLVLLAYQKETRLVSEMSERHNQLLGEAVGVFYQSQKIDRIQPLLVQTIPDIKLADKVFDVALQAEAKNNRPLAKNLLSWIQDSGLKHQDSAQKLGELAEPEATQSLDSTLVIEPGQSTSQTLSAMVFQVEQFGRYQVEGILGKGAMGIVYQGVDPKINRHVAIKTLQLSDAVESDSLDETKSRFFREAETAGNLSHANIVTIYDVGEEGELGYIAMDLLTGAPLSEFVKPENKLPAPLVYQLMIQITDALDYAHKQNVVHRDIKPGNIIFDDEIQRVTVTDFGIAFVADNSKTRTGTIMGSPYYMSPEQVLGKRVDGRSDIFSLGVTFYQLLSGHLPFNGESIASVAYHITKSKQTSVRQWDSKLPASAARITNKALQKDVGKRYQTMDEFKQVLISALKRDFKKAPIV